MSRSRIEWTDRVWNPVRGCSRVSEGCRNCYAERQASRFASPGERWTEAEDPTEPGPFHGFVRDGKWTGRVELVREQLEAPLRWRKPARVFVNSMSDLFHESLPDEAIDQVFAVMALAQRHTFQVLTKRPERMRDWLLRGRDEFVLDHYARIADIDLTQEERTPFPWPLRNVWLGVSVEDQKAANERIPILLETMAAVRFLSVEPLIGPVDLDRLIERRTRWHMQMDISGAIRNREFRGYTDDQGKPLSPAKAEIELKLLQAKGVRYLPLSRDCAEFDPIKGCPSHPQPSVDWVIVGGESGPGARSCDVAWVREIVEACKARKVACFVKQLGAKPWADQTRCEEPANHWIHRLRHPKGGNPEEWPVALRVREFPEVKP